MRIDVVTHLPGGVRAGARRPPCSASRGARAARRPPARPARLGRGRAPPGRRLRRTAAGPGMVMKPEPFFRAVRDIKAAAAGECTVVLMTPQGRRFDQRIGRGPRAARAPHRPVRALRGLRRAHPVAGRPAALDRRLRADRAASCPRSSSSTRSSRLIPGVLGHEDSAAEESFSWRAARVPAVHAARRVGGHVGTGCACER